MVGEDRADAFGFIPVKNSLYLDPRVLFQRRPLEQLRVVVILSHSKISLVTITPML